MMREMLVSNVPLLAVVYIDNVHSSQFRMFHPDDIVCRRKIGLWPDNEKPLGEEWEGVFLEKIPCDAWQDLRHERPVLVRKFQEVTDKVPALARHASSARAQLEQGTYHPADYVHALPESMYVAPMNSLTVYMLGDANTISQMGTGPSTSPRLFSSTPQWREVLRD